MRINFKMLAAAVVFVLMIAAGVLAFCAYKGKYMFRSEPQLQRQQVILNKRQLKDRERIESELLRDRLPLDTQRQAYDAIKEHTFKADGSRFRLTNNNKNDLEMALYAFRGDHPEVFWLNPEAYYKYYEDNNSVTVELNFSETGGALAEDRKLLEAAVKEAVSGAPDNANDYEVELYINDYLSDRCVYDTEGSEKHSAFGALVEGRAVCDGYSHAFQLLCRRLGIECTVVEGTSDFNEDEDDGHMWNCVQLGGEWYHVDVTWNDAAEAVCGVERYFYLNLTTEQISVDHVISGGYEARSDNRGNYFNLFVPACECDDLNYMRLNLVCITDAEEDDQIIAALLEAARDKSDYCAFLVEETVEFVSFTMSVTDKYAAQWVQGANRFLEDGYSIKTGDSIITYDTKRVLVMHLHYASAS